MKMDEPLSRTEESLVIKSLYLAWCLDVATAIYPLLYHATEQKAIELKINQMYKQPPTALSAQIIPDVNNDGRPDLRVDFNDGTSRAFFGIGNNMFSEKLSGLETNVVKSKTEIQPEDPTQSLEG